METMICNNSYVASTAVLDMLEMIYDCEEGETGL